MEMEWPEYNGNVKVTPERVAAFQTAKEQVEGLNQRGPIQTEDGYVAQLVGDKWMTKKVSLFGEHWETFSGRFPASGSLRNGVVFERPTWGHRIGENECSSWPSLRSEDLECCGNHPGATDSLTGATKQWKTPHGLAGKDCSGVGGEFAKQANQWAMPRAGVKVSEASLNFPSSRPDPPTPKDGSDSSPTTPGSRRRLNPAFGCLLMAWPWWWTQTEPISFAQSAMAAYRSRLRRHLLNCLAGQGLTGGGR